MGFSCDFTNKIEKFFSGVLFSLVMVAVTFLMVYFA